ncbi:MAG: tRNA dihydrouridine synthase DusB [Archangiaceae bacterium]|nr:tRNA dihydrouridine synthase DusB [Archangiaceae bacterium]
MLPIGPYTLRNRWILAPMAGVSEMPFRVLAFQMGAALCPTELVSAQGLMRLSARTMRYLRHDSAVEQPYSLQIFGGEPEVMAKAAVVAKEQGAQIIDINMGCPVKKVTKTGAGSGLMCDPPRAGELVRLIREATGLPVTAKIRAGWDHANKNFLQMADVLGAAGVKALAIHPRTRAQGYSGQADWSCITALKAHVGSAFPVIGNGDVKTVADAHRMLETTGCDYVMIGRGALGNPWLFRQLGGGEGPSPEERCRVVMDHFQKHVEFVLRDFRPRRPEEATPEGLKRHAESTAVHTFHKHLGWYAHGLVHASVFRAEVNKLETVSDVLDACERFFHQAQLDARAAEEEYDVDYRQALG